MTIIVLPLMMMILMTQSSLVTQSLNHFCQEALEYPPTEVGCLSFTQMFQDYLHEYPPYPAYSQIHKMAQRLDMYLNQYPAQYINFMTSDSEFVAFVKHTIQIWPFI